MEPKMRKIKIRRGEIQNIYYALMECRPFPGFRFSCAVAENLGILDPKIKVAQTASKSSAGYIEYERKRVAICQELCEKDDKDRPKIQNAGTPQEQYVGLADNEEFKKRLEKLREENKKVIEDDQKQQEEFSKYLQEEIKMELMEMNLSDFPKEETTGAILIALKPIINNDIKKEKKK